MRRLALDTSSLACTVALSVDAQLFERHEEQARAHTRLLMPMIRAVLADAGVALADLDAVVLGNGPGSFIGVRIAASVAQGLAHGAGLDIIPVSSLAAVAAEVLEKTDAGRVAVAQDAHMQEAYFGVYERCATTSVRAVCDERLQAVARIRELSAEDADTTVLAGQGWQRYPQLAALNERGYREVAAVNYPRAAYLLTLSEFSTAVAARDIRPAYLRHKVAERPATNRL